MKVILNLLKRALGRVVAPVVEHLVKKQSFARLVAMSSWLGLFLNKQLITMAIGRARHRPHPFATANSYTSWSGLSDKRWSARHLPQRNDDDAVLPDWEWVDDEGERKGLVRLFSREKHAGRFCRKSSCLFPAFAQYLTDGFIRTQDDDNALGGGLDPVARKRNTSNHEVDLCQLYGLNETQTHALRVTSRYIDGVVPHEERGLLRSQMIEGEEYAEFLYERDRIAVVKDFDILDAPLGLASVLEKFHEGDAGAVASARKQLDTVFAFGGDRTNSVPHTAMINILLLREHNRLARRLGELNPGWDDDRVFETARNIMIFQAIKIVVQDYMNHISPYAVPFQADPSIAWNAEWNRPNWITTEFSLLYRWHALVPGEITWGGEAKEVKDDYFLNNRPLLDVGLARAFEDMSAQPAGKLGPFNTIEDLLHVECKSIEQGRICDLDTYNAYRRYLGFDPAESFEDISSCKDVQDILKEEYGDVDQVEFFTGIFAENVVPNSPLPQTILSFVAVDAFSQALVNPLLSKSIIEASADKDAPDGSGHPVFSDYGMAQIEACDSLLVLLRRNVEAPERLGYVGMTLEGFERE